MTGSTLCRRPGAWRVAVVAAALTAFTALGCLQPNHEGPGRRSQSLALTPAQETALGQKAYAEVLARAQAAGTLLPAGHPEVQRVRHVGDRIRQASQLEPLQREINLNLKDYHFDWDFNVIREKQINAFCMPGGKIVVFTGLLTLVQPPGPETDAQLATVMAHEVAHALAHHANERIAREQMQRRALEAASGAFGTMHPEERKKLAGLLAGGVNVSSLAYDRAQESEADHIGVFLMTFAGYDPRQAVVFWERMEQATAQRGSPPEVLSTHPSHGRRIRQLEVWVPQALAAKQAYDRGDIQR
jgi:predicted Zn-dependent protease